MKLVTVDRLAVPYALMRRHSTKDIHAATRGNRGDVSTQLQGRKGYERVDAAGTYR